MLKLVKPEQEVFARWFEESTRRQAEDRAWAEGGDVQGHRARLDAMIPKLLPEAGCGEKAAPPELLSLRG